ncbi:hypothetical protein U1Q18_048240 [Sarracenia purpurea var. burkii]
MESQYHAPPRMDDSRPSIGFPLGTALLLIIIFGLSGIFSCCYHWDKIRSLRRSFSGDVDDDGTLSKPTPTCLSSKKDESQSLPVLMPGDQIAKFIALPCPCKSPPEGKLIVEVQKPPQLLSVSLSLPSRMAVPLY